MRLTALYDVVDKLGGRVAFVTVHVCSAYGAFERYQGAEDDRVTDPSTFPARDRAVPNLPSRDFESTEAFYGAFGFERLYRSNEWMILARGDLQLEFFPFPDLDPATSSFMCCLRVADVDELHAAIRESGVPVRSAGIPRLGPVRPQMWGARAGYLIDVDGTQLALIDDSAGRLGPADTATL